MKSIVLTDFTKALLLGFLCHLPILIIWNDPIYSKAVLGWKANE